MKDSGLLVTFYSYKGGVGRTMALANVGALLAIWGYRVLCVDWDLEAPGLPLYLRPWTGDKLKPGLVDLMQVILSGGKPDWREYLTNVELPTSLGSLSLIQAGRQDGHYLERIQGIDWEALYRDKDFGSVVERWRNQWKQDFDFILLDSRTGITDAGGICSIQLPDVLIILLTANQQSIDGSLDVATKVTKGRSSLPFDRTKLFVIPVLSRFETRVEYDLAQKWLSKVITAFDPFIRVWASQDIEADSLVKFLRIPSIPYWSFGEEIPVISKGTADPEDIGYAYENLAALLSRRLSGTETLPHSRDAFVSAARLTPTRFQSLTTQTLPNEGVKVFLSFSHKDQELVEQLSAHLSLLRRSGLVQLWTDRKPLPAGSDWSAEQDLELEQADVILLLISPDYLASEYCYGVEMKRALERHLTDSATVIPVFLRPADWSLAPFSDLQALPDDGKPVVMWSNRDAAFANVAQGVRRAIEQRISGRLNRQPWKEWSQEAEALQSFALLKKGRNIWEVRISKTLLTAKISMILSVVAENPERELATKIPLLVKVSSSFFVHELVKRALPGLTLRLVAAPPPTVPVTSGAVYFSVTQSGPSWEHILETGLLGLYAPSDVLNPRWELLLLKE